MVSCETCLLLRADVIGMIIISLAAMIPAYIETYTPLKTTLLICWYLLMSLIVTFIGGIIRASTLLKISRKSNDTNDNSPADAV